MFVIAISTEVGNGHNTLFWTDRWLHRCRIEDLAPSIFACVAPRNHKTRTVAEAFVNDRWVTDIQGGLSWNGILEMIRRIDIYGDLMQAGVTPPRQPISMDQ